MTFKIDNSFFSSLVLGLLPRRIYTLSAKRFNRAWGLAFLGFLFLAMSGCAEHRIEDAFDGKFNSGKSNNIINEYCKSCHIHKNFDPAEHVRSVRANYKRPYFRRARECRACHYIEKNWVTNNYHRKTRNPKQANRGSYKDFEKDEIKQLKKHSKKKSRKVAGTP
jgi:hypothetical protein